jgi:hypothetical protein
MKTKTFQFKYSILVNGEEYPRTTRIQAATEAEATKTLKARLKKGGNDDYNINEITQLP